MRGREINKFIRPYMTGWEINAFRSLLCDRLGNQCLQVAPV